MQYAISLLFEKTEYFKDVEKINVKGYLITHSCEAENEYEALGKAIWEHNLTPNNGQLKLWQVQKFGSDLVEDQVMHVFREKGKIHAIKRRRELTGETLMEAKAVLDKLQVKYQMDHNGEPIGLQKPEFHLSDECNQG